MAINRGTTPRRNLRRPGPLARITSPQRTSSRLLQFQNKEFSSGDFSDCHIVCGDVVLKLHKIHLARGPYFRRILTSQNKITVEDRLPVLLPALYHLYTCEYIEDEAAWKQMVSTSTKTKDLPWEGGRAIYHAEMYEIGERFGMPSLQQQAHQCFVRLSGLLAILRREGDRCIPDSQDEVADEEDVIDLATFTDLACTIKSHETLSLMEPIVEVLIHALITIRDGKDQPLSRKMISCIAKKIRIARAW